ncbi:COG2426 family protein [Archaeoglobus profundus]|uniref:Small multi-drug export n=1 Tax=Archaeoglobus profundus (strain DSM 5631 / JCM 9629 / NBRC 100127 / Av18) TaxID=572546 RepID=D2RFV6_ARCPA|nr:small multi-drug export protein [Archaeoglobus profundus]ADB57181.1 putative small multi-drug export [Archaeoglobus profundus DSM 5631]
MDWLEVLIVSALPISELRGGIPLALYLGFDPLKAYIFSILGNLLPVPFLLIFLNLIERIALRTPLSRFYTRIVERTRRKKDLIEKYGYLGLSIFVAIPLPVTGAWTGCLLAFLLGLNRMKSFFYIALGVAIAGIIVLASSLGVFKVMGKA